MKLMDVLLLLEIEVKEVPGLQKGKKNPSYKCSNKKDFSEALLKLKEKGRYLFSIIIDKDGENIYISDRTTFHHELGGYWNIRGDHQIRLTANMNVDNFRLDHKFNSDGDKERFDRLDISSLARKILRS